MNTEVIRMLAGIIEAQPTTCHDDPSGFNMRDYVHPCGSPSCIAGWAVAMKYGDEYMGDTARVAAEILDLDEDWAFDNLFNPFDGELNEDITSQQAARALTER